MLKTVIKAEIRNMTRDKMYIFFCVFPIFLGVAGYFLVPYLRDVTPVGSIVPEIVVMMLILMTGYMFGALTAFTLLDDKDDFVLMSLKITPISVKYYVAVKLFVSFAFGFISTVILILATNFLPDSSIWTIFMISIVAALQAPGVTLIVNSFSDNKVEGFVIMKMSGLILAVPVVAFFVYEWQEIFLIVAPGFWSARMIQIELLSFIPTNFSIIIYFIFGIIYNLLFTYIFMKIYSKRSNI